jgi:hypothetical protein
VRAGSAVSAVESDAKSAGVIAVLGEDEVTGRRLVCAGSAGDRERFDRCVAGQSLEADLSTGQGRGADAVCLKSIRQHRGDGADAALGADGGALLVEQGVLEHQEIADTEPCSAEVDDGWGALTVTAGIGAAVYGIVRAPEVGWNTVQTWGVLAAAVTLLGLFVLLQARRAHPLVRLAIFRTPNLAAANTAQFMLGAAWIPMWFFLNLYLQQVLGYTAFPSGAALLPMTVLIMIGMITLAPKAIARFGPKAMVVTGLGVLAAGLIYLSFIRPDGNFWIDVLPASLVAALGMSLAFIPSLGTAISSAPPQEGGLAAGIVNTSYQLGSALGLAAITAVAASLGATQIDNPTALTDGFSGAFLGAGLIAAAGAVIAAITLHLPRPQQQKEHAKATNLATTAR